MTIYWARKNYFDNEKDIYTSSKIYEQTGYGLDLDMLTILY